MITPVNNQCLIEVLDEFSGLAHTSRDGQKGIVRAVNFTPLHLTASTGLLIPEEMRKIIATIAVDSLVGKTVRYALYADADSSSWQEDGKTWVLVPWYRVLGIEQGESDVSTTTDTKKWNTPGWPYPDGVDVL